MLTERARIGAWGEKAATKWLRERGYLIHALNWRNGRYELDIVAEKWDTMHFIEVKTRKADGWTTPESAMTRDKIRAFKRAVMYYVSQHRIESHFQYDLIAIDMYPDSSVEIRFYERFV